MPLLLRYVLRELLQVFGMTVVGLTLSLVVVGVIGEAAKSGLGPVQVARILPYVIPSLLPFTIPATFLLTVCLVYGRISGNHEITALKAAGINILAVLWPAFALGAILSLTTLLLTDLFVPWSRTKIDQIVEAAVEDLFLELLRNQNQFSDRQRGLVLTARQVEGRRLSDATFRYVLPGGDSAIISAKSATLKFDLQQSEVLVDLHMGNIETPSGISVSFERERRSFPLPPRSGMTVAPRNLAIQEIRRELAAIDNESSRTQNRRVLNTAFSLSSGRFHELQSEAHDSTQRKLDDAGHRRRKLITEIHSRIALACSCFLFALAGSPFAIQQAKRQFLTSFALCFAPIVLLYYPTVLLTMSLSRSGVLNPAWGMWIANIGLAIAGIWNLRKVL